MLNKKQKQELIKRIIKDMERDDANFLYVSDEENLICVEDKETLLALISSTIYKMSKFFKTPSNTINSLIKEGLRSIEEYEE